MADQDFDQTEDATPHKLKEARKKGSVAKSQDFLAMSMLAAGCLVLYAVGRTAFSNALLLQKRILQHPPAGQWAVDGVSQWLGQLLVAMVELMAPLFLCLVIVAVLANLAQTGPVFSFHPLVPDLAKLNPASGFKRLFSLRTLVEAFKSVVKLCVLGLLLYIVIRDAVPGLVSLPSDDPKKYPHVLFGLSESLLFKLVLGMLVIGLVDFVYTRWEFSKRMRMSKREVKEESKNREGDPRIRSRIRELRKEMLKKSRALAKVPSADVVVTNPTHIAVALSYRHGVSAAPQVIAKGAGELARKIRKLAGQHQIPVVQNRALARALFREVDYDGYVPEQLYPQVAKIMVWVYALRNMKR